MMKQWRAPLNKAPSKIGKEEQRPGNPSSMRKSKNPKWVTKGRGTNYVLEPLTSHKKHIKKGKGMET